jgi:hypothetical protein
MSAPCKLYWHFDYQQFRALSSASVKKANGSKVRRVDPEPFQKHSFLEQLELVPLSGATNPVQNQNR